MKFEMIRREYGELSLCETKLPESPLTQFTLWFGEELKTENSDPSAMVLSTIDEDNLPDSRVVLLKGLYNGNFIFYTNYSSEKAIQLAHKNYAALNFYWPEKCRQVRLRGKVKPTSKAMSDSYFGTRPKASQAAAIISPQSTVLVAREELELAFNELLARSQQLSKFPRPLNWGGYQVIPGEVEFWQGRNNRLHDRIKYIRKGRKWIHFRLAP